MVATTHLLLYSSRLAANLRRISTTPPPKTTISFPSKSQNPSLSLFLPKSDIADKLQSAFSGGGSGNGAGNGGGFINPSSSGGRDDYNDDEETAFFKVLGSLGRVLSGWFFRWIVTGDSQFPFMLLIKELVGGSGTAFYLPEKLWNGFGAQLQSAAEAVSEGFLLFPFMIVLLSFFPLFFAFAVAEAIVVATATGIIGLLFSAMAASLVATSVYALYCAIDWMRSNW